MCRSIASALAVFVFASTSPATNVSFAGDAPPAHDGSPATTPVPWTRGRQPTFTLDSLSNERIALADQRERIVLVHFFATWCEPCRSEMAALRRLADRISTTRSLTILAISVAEADARVRRFFAADPVNFPILLDRDRAVSKAWQVSTLPTTFVLDHGLRPKFVVEGDFDWDGQTSSRMLATLTSRHSDEPSAMTEDNAQP